MYSLDSSNEEKKKIKKKKSVSFRKKLTYNIENFKKLDYEFSKNDNLEENSQKERKKTKKKTKFNLNNFNHYNHYNHSSENSTKFMNENFHHIMKSFKSESNLKNKMKKFLNDNDELKSFYDNNNLSYHKPMSLNSKIYFETIENEAKKLTNTEEISNFYAYTKECMSLIVDLLKIKNKATFPSKIKIKNPDNLQKIAILDLDETLMHSEVNIKNFPNKDNIITILLPSQKTAKIGVYIRPNWEEAIKTIKKFYCIVVYTASYHSYANAVLDFMDPENKYFYNRLYRNDCISIKYKEKYIYIKDMSIFEGFDEKDIVIIDNSVTSFAFHLNNGIPILPYYNQEKDFELLLCSCYLENIAEDYDLREINKKYMKLNYYLKKEIEKRQDEKKKRKKCFSRCNSHKKKLYAEENIKKEIKELKIERKYSYVNIKRDGINEKTHTDLSIQIKDNYNHFRKKFNDNCHCNKEKQNV
jgi:CTD small phosphatase-like protein 2